MKHLRWWIPIVVVIAGLSWLLLRPAATIPHTSTHAERAARIAPDYRDSAIPPNIAPLNFVIREPGKRFVAHIHCADDDGFVVSSHSPSVVIPIERWRGLLDRNRGNLLYFDVYIKGREGRWSRFESIVNRIAEDEIDSHVAYRLLTPVHNIFRKMGTYQRELTTYRESPILVSEEGVASRCVNCHTFDGNNPDRMLLHTRGNEGVAMLLARDGKVTKIDTRTDERPTPAAYPAWHPSGRIIAFSTNKMDQFFHTSGNARGVFNYDSDLVLYLVDSNRIVTGPKIADPDRLETFPAWSPDGRYLYFASAARSWAPRRKEEGPVPDHFREVRYDLVRVEYEAESGAWGELETLLTSQQTGLSITEPRVSPDGRFVLVSMAEYGSFPVFLNSSDLYMIDLETMECRPLPLNSRFSDSWHGWSANGRWIVFASKRGNGLFGRIYFSHVNAEGRVGRPFLLPQKDPTFYDSCLNTYNAPELLMKPVGVPQKEFLRAIYATDPLPAEFGGE